MELDADGYYYTLNSSSNYSADGNCSPYYAVVGAADVSEIGTFDNFRFAWGFTHGLSETACESSKATVIIDRRWRGARASSHPQWTDWDVIHFKVTEGIWWGTPPGELSLSPCSLDMLIAAPSWGYEPGRAALSFPSVGSRAEYRVRVLPETYGLPQPAQVRITTLYPAIP